MFIYDPTEKHFSTSQTESMNLFRYLVCLSLSYHTKIAPLKFRVIQMRIEDISHGLKWKIYIGDVKDQPETNISFRNVCLRMAVGSGIQYMELTRCFFPCGSLFESYNVKLASVGHNTSQLLRGYATRPQR